MKHIDEEKLEVDLAYRFQYLVEFIGITEDDLEAVQGAAGALAPLVPALVDAVYDQLFRYNCTKRHFVPRQSGYAGEIPESSETLTLDRETEGKTLTAFNKLLWLQNELFTRNYQA